MTPPLPPVPLAHDDLSLARLLESAREPVIVESHYGGWERPWRLLGADAWATLRRELGEHVQFASVDTGLARDFARRHQCEVLPELHVFLGGQAVARLHGLTTVRDVLEAVRAAVAEGHEHDQGLEELTGRPALAKAS
jgi:thioredoxin-like negative regulator of GroEL